MTTPVSQTDRSDVDMTELEQEDVEKGIIGSLNSPKVSWLSWIAL